MIVACILYMHIVTTTTSLLAPCSCFLLILSSSIIVTINLSSSIIVTITRIYNNYENIDDVVSMMANIYIFVSSIYRFILLPRFSFCVCSFSFFQAQSEHRRNGSHLDRLVKTGNTTDSFSRSWHWFFSVEWQPFI